MASLRNEVVKVHCTSLLQVGLYGDITLYHQAGAIISITYGI